MARLSDGEREFVSDFGELRDAAQQPTAAPLPAPVPGLRAGVRELDARTLVAPLPLLEAHRALRALHAGDELRVITSYQGSLAEFQALAKYETNFELVSQDITGEDFVHLLRKRR
jgi:TusA-related sulfurtransferase